MDSKKNIKFEVGLPASPYSLALNYNRFMQSLATTNCLNLMMNSQFTSITTSGSLLGWNSSGNVTVGNYDNVNGNRNVTFAAGAYIDQPVYYTNSASSIQLTPYSIYSLMLYSSATTAFKIQVIAPSANQIFNIEDFSQSPSISAVLASASSGELYAKTYTQFSTSSSALFLGPISVRIINTSGVSASINLSYIALYQGDVEFAYLPDKYKLKLSLDNGTAALPSLNFIQSTNTGIFSKEQNGFSISTNGVERITFTSDGNILINKLSNDGINTVQVSGSARIYGNFIANTISTTTGTFTSGITANNILLSNNLSAVNIYASGNIKGNTVSTTSSSRYKYDIETLKNALSTVLNLRGVKYKSKYDKSENIGLIAEEVNEILPEVVKYTPEGLPDAISYGNIIGLLVEAIKELNEEIEKIRNHIF